MHTVIRRTVVATAIAWAGISCAIAQQADAPSDHVLGQHPAVLVQQQRQSIDPNRYIVAHPAGLSVIATPSPTYDHPAVAVARLYRQGAGQLEQKYLAQPPVGAAWLRQPDAAFAARSAHSGS